MSEVCKAFRYSENTVPDGYKCGECGAMGVRLYRLYQTVLDYQKLHCRACALKDQGMSLPDGEHTIGWLVAAVPTEDGDTYWGYTSVPQPGVDWWDRLPRNIATTARREEGQ